MPLIQTFAGASSRAYGFENAAKASGLPVLTNLAGWWDPSDATSVTLSSGKVSQLNDKSGNGRHLIQATSTAQPIYATAYRNGLNALQFSGAQKMVTSANWTMSDVTFFMVVKFNGSVGENASGYGSYQLELGHGDRVGNNVWSWTLTPGGGGSYFNWNDGTADSNWHYHDIIRGIPSAAVDGGGSFSAYPGGGPLNTLQANSVYTIGARSDGGTTMTGYIAESVMYSGQLSSGDRLLVRDYLKTKWGF